MNARSKARVPLVGLLALGVATNSLPVAAGGSAPSRPYTLALGLEQFRWQEYDGLGQRLLTEQGPRGVVRLDISTRERPVWQLRARLKAYAGVVDYDGQDGQGTFVSSDTDYRGGSGEVELALHGRSPARDRLDLELALGIEAWRRDISDSHNANGDPVAGFREDYRMGAGRLGIGYTVARGRYRSEWQAGLYRPFRVDEDIVLYGRSLRLHPRPRWSAYLAWRLEAGRNILELRYEGRRFAASDPIDVVNPVTANTETVWQPRSQADLIELNFGYRF